MRLFDLPAADSALPTHNELQRQHERKLEQTAFQFGCVLGYVAGAASMALLIAAYSRWLA